MAIGDRARERRRRKERKEALAAKQKQKAREEKRAYRRQVASSFGQTAGEILQSSQEFAHSQAQQTRDRGAASQAHIQEVAPQLAAAYLGTQLGVGAPPAAPAVPASALPGWALPAAAAGAGALWWMGRKK